MVSRPLISQPCLWLHLIASPQESLADHVNTPSCSWRRSDNQLANPFNQTYMFGV